MGDTMTKIEGEEKSVRSNHNSGHRLANLRPNLPSRSKPIHLHVIIKLFLSIGWIYKLYFDCIILITDKEILVLKWLIWSTLHSICEMFDRFLQCMIKTTKPLNVDIFPVSTKNRHAWVRFCVCVWHLMHKEGKNMCHGYQKNLIYILCRGMITTYSWSF